MPGSCGRVESMRHDWSHALSITLRFSPSHTALFTAREASYRLARNKSGDLCSCGCSSQCTCTHGLQASRPRCGGHGASSLTPIMTCALWGDLCSFQRRSNGARNLDAIHGAKRLKVLVLPFRQCPADTRMAINQHSHAEAGEQEQHPGMVDERGTARSVAEDWAALEGCRKPDCSECETSRARLSAFSHRHLD